MKVNIFLIIMFTQFIFTNCEIANNSNDEVEVEKALTDIDGNVYSTVTIGDQTWITENFRATRFNDSTPIPLIINDSAWIALSTPGYCFDQNTTLNDSINNFGALYNWYVIETGKISPEGWHVPDATDWNKLRDFLVENGYNWDESFLEDKAAKALAGKTGWYSSIVTGAVGCDLSKNNKSGFTALPGGCRDGLTGKPCYDDESTYTMWWTSSESTNDNFMAFHRDLYCNSEKLYSYPGYKTTGMYLRLIKD